MNPSVMRSQITKVKPSDTATNAAVSARTVRQACGDRCLQASSRGILVTAVRTVFRKQIVAVFQSGSAEPNLAGAGHSCLRPMGSE